MVTPAGFAGSGDFVNRALRTAEVGSRSQARRRQPGNLIGRFAGRRREKIGLDGAGHLDHERLASAIKRFACSRPDPLLAHTIFFDVAPFDAAKADADTASQRGFAIIRT